MSAIRTWIGSTGDFLAKRIVISAAVLMVATFAACVSSLLGTLGGEWNMKQRRFSFEKDAIASVLAADPAFARIEILMYTGDGSAYLLGEVSSDADLDRLRSSMRNLLGNAREVEPSSGVSTAEDMPDIVLK